MTTQTSRPLLQLIRAAGHALALVAIAIWAFSAWELPWPGMLTGIGVTVLAVVIWAVFLSPRPVLQADRFGLSLVELLFVGAGVAAMLASGWPWIIPVLFGLIAAALGYFAPDRKH